MGGGEVIKRGWLIKSPPLEGGGIKAWRRRFFMLRSSKVLEYYKNEDGDVLKGVINLEDCKTVHSDLSHKKYKHVFDVETKDRTYYLVAHTQDEMKAWVEVLCRVCGLIVQDVPEFLTSATDATQVGGSTASGPMISPPLYATPPIRGNSGGGLYATPPAIRTEGGGGSYTTLPVTRSGNGAYASPPIARTASSGATGGGVSFNERFRPSGEGAAIESMYSLAHSVDVEVQRQLSGEQEIPAGIPLSEALASKGISSSSRTSSVSLASGGDATANFNPDSPSFLSPHHEPAKDSQNLYSPVPKKPSSSSSSSSSSGGVVRPVPKPRSATLNPTTPRTTEQLGSPAQQQLTSSMTVSDSVTLGPHPTQLRAEIVEDGYLKAVSRQAKKTSNYDQLPPGPPRPAVKMNAQSSPRQHRSALLNPTVPQGIKDVHSSTNPSPANATNTPTYINVQPVAEEVPPTVDRRSKPAMPSPPRIDRNLKPKDGGSGEDTPTAACSDSSSSSDSPPMFPVRTTSLANTLDSQQQPQAKSGDSPPEFPVRTTSLEVSASASGREEEGAIDLPKPSTRTMQYTQIAFSPGTGNPVLLDDGGNPGNSSTDVRRNPVPAPRGVRRVNYSDVDLVASEKLSEAAAAAKIGPEAAAKVGPAAAAKIGPAEATEIQVTLREAEIQALKDKPYVNVDRKGDVDEETDPGYYTHMRNLTYQEALEIYNRPIDLDDDDEENDSGDVLSNGVR